MNVRLYFDEGFKSLVYVLQCLHTDNIAILSQL